MKNTICFLLILASISVFSQNSEYAVSSYLTEGAKAPNTHYIGEAWLNAIIHDDKELVIILQRQPLKPTQPWIGINIILHKS